eukprot:gene6505-10513_t
MNQFEEDVNPSQEIKPETSLVEVQPHEETETVSPLRGKLTLYLIRFTIYIFSLILLFNVTRFFIFLLFYRKAHVLVLLSTVETIAQVYSLVCSIPPIIISLVGIFGLVFIDRIRYRSIQELLLVGLISFTSLWCSLALFFAAICLISFAFIKIDPFQILQVVAIPIAFSIADIAFLSFSILLSMIVVVFKFSYDYKVAQGFQQLVETEDENLTFEDKLYRKIEKVFLRLGVLEHVNQQEGTHQQLKEQDDDTLENTSVLNEDLVVNNEQEDLKEEKETSSVVE